MNTASNPPSMLSARGLMKSFGAVTAADNINIDVPTGQRLSLIGSNGAGKTTFVNMVTGYLKPDSGSIVLDGKDITGDPMYTRAKQGVGYLPQEPSVFRKLTVADNIRLVLELREDLDSAGIERELASLLDELQISHVADQLGASLSGGERRRVEIARALAARPRRLPRPARPKVPAPRLAPRPADAIGQEKRAVRVTNGPSLGRKRPRRAWTGELSEVKIIVRCTKVKAPLGFLIHGDVVIAERGRGVSTTPPFGSG